MQITLITGEQNSGKSEFAENLISERYLDSDILYIGTLPYYNDSFKSRIIKHQSRRKNRWNTIEIIEKNKIIRFEEEILVYDQNIVLIDGVHILYLQQLINEKVNPIRPHINKLLKISEFKELYLVIPYPPESNPKDKRIYQYFDSIKKISNSIFQI